ncbi:TPA: hypothetical protein G8K98_003450 [Salmonella enterica]|nr:hypothetical protein [Salmonella enterica]HBI5290111.1 hypothetical protein [Salmonella enterica]
MDTGKIVEIEKSYYEHKRNATIGVYIILVGAIIIVANVMGWSHETQIMQGIVLGGGLVYWGMNFDKYTKMRKQLDTICIQRYGKEYKNSLSDIVSERFGNKNR